MKALILAAGRGERLRPLTDTTPKPLLPVADHRLFDWQLAALKKADVTDVVINTAHRAAAFNAIPAELKKEGFRVSLSQEGTCAADALETLGGIAKALPLLTDGTEPFIVLAGDVVHAFDIKRLTAQKEALIKGEKDAHLVVVPNPAFNRKGDLALDSEGKVVPGSGPYTYGCLMIASPRIFKGVPATRAKLFPWLWQFKITAEVFDGFWDNIGSPTEYERLLKNTKAQELLAW